MAVNPDLTVSYMQILGAFFPAVNAKCSGDPNIYGDIIWQGGDPIPPQIELDPLRLKMAIIAVNDDIDTQRDALMYDHFSWSEHRWNSDRNSLGNLIGILTLGMLTGGTLPSNFVYRDYDNINVPLTMTQLGQLGNAAFQFLTSCYVKAWTLKAQVDALTNYTDVINFNDETGWPLPGFTVPVSGILQSNKQFQVVGNFVAQLTNDWTPSTIVVSGSANNNGTYTVAALSFDGTSTTITVIETIASPIVDGSIYIA